MNTVQRQAPAGRHLLLLRLRFRAGQPVTLPEVLDAAGLTPNQRRVLCERLAGRSCGEIAGEACSRQAVKISEGRACERLGLPVSIAEAVHAAQRADQAAQWSDRAKLVNGAELHGDGPVRCRRKPSRRDLIHARLDRLADQWLTADAAGRVHLSMEARRAGEQLARLGR